MPNENSFKRENSYGVPKLLPPLHPSLENHPRYRLRDLVSSDKGEDKDRVCVEHYVHDKSFKERVKFYFVTDQRSSIRRQILRFVLKIVSCVLYVVRVCQDTEPHRAGGYDCPENRTGADWACPVYDIKTNYYAWSLLWVHRPYPLWIIQTVIAVYSILEALLLCYLTYKGGTVLNQIVNTRVIPEILLGLPFFASVSKAVIKCGNYRVAWFEKLVVQIERC